MTSSPLSYDFDALGERFYATTYDATGSIAIEALAIRHKSRSYMRVAVVSLAHEDDRDPSYLQQPCNIIAHAKARIVETFEVENAREASALIVSLVAKYVSSIDVDP